METYLDKPLDLAWKIPFSSSLFYTFEMANLVKTPDSIKRKSQKHSQEFFSDQLAIVGISGF